MDNTALPIPRKRNTDLKFWLMWVFASTAAILTQFCCTLCSDLDRQSYFSQYK